KFVAVGASAIAIILFGLLVVPALGTSGRLGPAIQASFLANAQVGGDPVLAGRSEFPVLLATVMERPIVGWGQVPYASSDILTSAGKIAETFHMNVGGATLGTWINPVTGEVSAHSVLMQLWIVSGVLGLALGLLIVLLLMRAILNGTRSADLNAGLLFLHVCLLWDMFFSPMIGGRDLLLASAIAMILESRPSGAGSDLSLVGGGVLRSVGAGQRIVGGLIRRASAAR
ncbi:MAG: hypothetical protein ACYCTH_09090, partial [Cellulomonas sp.]